MGRLPGLPGDWRSSPAFWAFLSLSLLVMLVGAALAFFRPQYGGVLVSVGFAGLALTAVIAGMASLRSRRRPDERLREAP
ncbi:MAG: hypothetical protein AB1689_09725 [Thermodesulfobacteriota bacterium]